jgi:23S rRNA (adenine2503-C2)-methyltransferase
MKPALFGKTYAEIIEITTSFGFQKFTAKQICDRLYKHKTQSFDDFTELSKKNRAVLAEKFDIGLSAPVNEQVSKDGTKKYLYKTDSEKFIETAYIPEDDRATLCVSSQVGCKMGCKFCQTARQGFNGHLSVNEILNQIQSLPERDLLTNIVFMGMGEPLDNIDAVLKACEILTAEYAYAWSPKRVTVSTIGELKGLKKFLDQSHCHLAVSLHNPFDVERRKLMPSETSHPIKDVLTMIRNHDFGRQRRVSFEYIMFKDYNDTLRHANELVRILSGIKSRVNLIRFHAIPDSDLQGSSDETINHFAELLTKKGVRTTVRKSRGMDIDAACGMLSTKKMMKGD